MRTTEMKVPKDEERHSGDGRDNCDIFHAIFERGTADRIPNGTSLRGFTSRQTMPVEIFFVVVCGAQVFSLSQSLQHEKEEKNFIENRLSIEKIADFLNERFANNLRWLRIRIPTFGFSEHRGRLFAI